MLVHTARHPVRGSVTQSYFVRATVVVTPTETGSGLQVSGFVFVRLLIGRKQREN